MDCITQGGGAWVSETEVFETCGVVVESSGHIPVVVGSSCPLMGVSMDINCTLEEAACPLGCYQY